MPEEIRDTDKEGDYMWNGVVVYLKLDSLESSSINSHLWIVLRPKKNSIHERIYLPGWTSSEGAGP